jgi:hypothetical protein
MPSAIHLLHRLAYQIITLITAHTTLTPTRKLDDAFTRPRKRLVFPLVFPFRLLGVEFSTRATSLSTRVARAKIKMWMGSYLK